MNKIVKIEDGLDGWKIMILDDGTSIEIEEDDFIADNWRVGDLVSRWKESD